MNKLQVPMHASLVLAELKKLARGVYSQLRSNRDFRHCMVQDVGRAFGESLRTATTLFLLRQGFGGQVRCGLALP